MEQHEALTARDKAIAACGRAMAGTNNSNSTGDNHRSSLPHARGRQDLEAIKRRYHQADTQRAVVNYLAEAHGWNSWATTVLVSTFEYLRWELLGVRLYPGVKRNVAAYWERLSRDPALDLMLSVRQQCSGLQALPTWKTIAFRPGDLNDSVDEQFQFAVRLVSRLQESGLMDSVMKAIAKERPTGENSLASAPSDALLTLPEWIEQDNELLQAEEDNLSDQALEQTSPSLIQRPNRDNYRIYDSSDDQVVYHGKTTAGQTPLLTDAQKFLVRRQRQVVKKLARELTRRLLARSQPEWYEDIDEGRLYPARFSRIISSPHLPPMRLRERRRERLDSVVCLLLDNSGSMRGLPIRLGLESCALLAEALDVCGVKTEILGFTTADAETNQALKRWQAQGKPSQPGRLNSLRHIVYKTADQPWRQARRHFATHLDPALMQENIDGEALLWARQRLLYRPEARKILIVIGDGKPCDPATREANGNHFLGNDFLGKHLRDTIEQMERDGIIELSAIGTSPVVSRYYTNAVILGQVETLGRVLIEQVRKLFLRDYM